MAERQSPAARVASAPDAHLILTVAQGLQQDYQQLEAMQPNLRDADARRLVQQALALRHRFLAELQQQTDQALPARRSPQLTLRLQQLLVGRLPGSEQRALARMDAGLTSLLYLYLQVLEANPSSASVRELLQRQQAGLSQAQSDLRLFIGKPGQ